MVFRTFILTTLLMLSLGSLAADSEGIYKALGHATDSCGKFVEAANKGLHKNNWAKWNIYLAFTYGYFTGVNRYRSDTLDIMGNTDQAGVMGHIEKYCRENPLSDYFYAVMSAENELYKNRVK